jgi:hypothetical protein
MLCDRHNLIYAESLLLADGFDYASSEYDVSVITEAQSALSSSHPRMKVCAPDMCVVAPKYRPQVCM